MSLDSDLWSFSISLVVIKKKEEKANIKVALGFQHFKYTECNVGKYNISYFLLISKSQKAPKTG